MEQFGILSLGSRLKRLSDFLYSEVQAVYGNESLMISSTYFPILRLLQQECSLSVVQISERLGLSHPAVSKQVAKMLKEGLLLKIQDESDLRRSAICLSELSQQEMHKAEPVLMAIGMELDFYLRQLSGPFLMQLEGLESKLLNGPYAKRVILRLHPELLEIRDCQSSEDYAAFKALNMAWLERFFSDDIYEKDHLLLNNPETHILAKGGKVKVATLDNKAIGTYFIMPTDRNMMELGKLAVDERFQRLGVGERLLEDAISAATAMNAVALVLESHTLLEPALGLYQKFGFAVDSSSSSFSVPRANIRMIKHLGGSHERL
ncbi:GNAT family N-acetyltransferase [Maribrevibacterium harenarium]|uniref:GNAT family N-acetyltransferase n=1 Tax=Maribrevibacterium harenarium TaxID=2589817 RepID=A0A501X5F5_9GAMM|nr:bifunctional helix-turn-helix transcriptional regulator/GNAT family N-acetyltransferase [Maribrevibacterium harenarium]TPE55688.1 GNAT family N-acetyltransferase [Maribrevibacterium harenarium]